MVVQCVSWCFGLTVSLQLPALDYKADTKLSCNFPLHCWSLGSSYLSSYINVIFDINKKTLYPEKASRPTGKDVY